MGTPRENQRRAVLRNSKSSGGIRLGDFLDMCKTMRAYDARLRLECWSILAWFAMEGNGVDYDYVCEPASTKNGRMFASALRTTDPYLLLCNLRGSRGWFVLLVKIQFRCPSLIRLNISRMSSSSYKVVTIPSRSLCATPSL